MFFEKHDEGDGYRVWLSQTEVEELLDAAEKTQHRLAFELGARCGLRTHEIVRVCPVDVKDTEAGRMLRVESAKSDRVRQVPIPDEIAIRIESIDAIRDERSDEEIIQSSKRTVRRWMSRATDTLSEETGDEMWDEVSLHDLRRTWATSLKSSDIDSLLICEFGGWSDLDTFLTHYKGRYSPEAKRKARDKVEWL